MPRIPPPLKWQLLGLASYLLFLYVLPHSFAFDFERDSAFKPTRMAGCVLAWLLICLPDIRQRTSWHWRYALIGAALPLLIGIASAVSLPLMVLDHWTRHPVTQGPPWNEWRLAAGVAGSALTYAWLCATLCSRTRRWWTALVLGLVAFALLLTLDFILIAWATGPHRLH